MEDSFIRIFEKNWDILITGLIIAFSFQFVLNPNYTFLEKVLYSFFVGFLLIGIYSFFQWMDKTGNKIIVFIVFLLGVLLSALIYYVKLLF